MSGRLRQRQLAILSTVLICTSAIPVHAATIFVTNTNDDGTGSLRQALRSANDGDTINFAVTGTITLASGGLPINKNVTISGPGADQLSIDGNQALFVFGVFFDRAVTISDLTVRNAQESGVLNDGTVTVINCVLSNSLYGLASDGAATVSSCVLTGNAEGLYSYEGVTTISNCVINGNADGGVCNSIHFGPNNSIAAAVP